METEAIRNTMQGYVSAEKQKFERLASKMKCKEKDLAIKSEKLRQVEELIKNSPCVVGKTAASRYPLRDKNESHSCDEAVSCGESAWKRAAHEPLGTNQSLVSCPDPFPEGRSGHYRQFSWHPV